MHPVLHELRAELKTHAEARLIASAKRFFKEPILAYGVKTATTRKTGRAFYPKVKHLSKDDLFNLIEDLWKSGIIEESFIAEDWCFKRKKEFEPTDFTRFEHWILTYINNWASCDGFCTKNLGAFIEMYPAFIDTLKTRTSSDNRWMRRACAVAFIKPASKGLFLEDIFEIADRLLLDSDDLVQKGYGWMLKVASEKHQAEVFEYVMQKKHIMPRTALRYAIEKMPDFLRKEAMKKPS